VSCVDRCVLKMYFISALLYISIASIRSIEVEHSPRPSVGLSLWKAYCGKMAEWIRMPFGMVSGVGRGMGALDGVVIFEWGRAVLGVNLGVPL